VPGPILALLTVAAALVAARWPGRVGFTVLVASIVLLPTTLVLPNGLSSYLTVHRVVLIGLLVGLLVRERSRIWRPTPTSLAFVLFLFLLLVAGVMLASPTIAFSAELSKYVDFVEQAVVLVVCTAIVRRDRDPAWFVYPLTAVLLVSAGIGVIEHFTHASWSHWLFSRLPSQKGSPAAGPLALRQGQVRVRGGNDYPLGYAWVLAALLPFLVVASLRLKRSRPLLLVGGSALVVAGIYWSYSRSALLGILVALVVTGLAARDRRVGVVVCAAVALGVAAFVFAPQLSHHFSSAVDQGSIDVRQQRIPIVLQAVAHRPWTGLGLNGLLLLGLPATDATYLLAYGEAGVAGLAGLVGLLGVAAFGVARGASAQPPHLRRAAAAALGGALAIVAAGLAFDAMALLGTADVLWIVVAVGLVIGERARRPVSMRVVPDLFAPFVALAALAGVALVLLAPSHYAQDLTFTTLPVVRDSAAYDPVVTGDQLIATACNAIEAQTSALSGVSTNCRNLYTAPGVGALRVQARSADDVRSAEATLAQVVKSAGISHYATSPASSIERGRPTLYVTAPLWLTVAVVMLLFALSDVVLRVLAPRARARRRLA
jgi:O-antigen ligase/polysaccharide polymerase Wzy-like membrane protein